MIVLCPKCECRYDDEFRWTICPHNPLYFSHDEPYCREHDLFHCHVCASANTGASNEPESPKRAPHKRLLPWLLIGIILAIVFLALLLWPLRAEEPEPPFVRNYNSFSNEMNILKSKLENNVADRKQFQKCARLWNALYADPEWLK